MTLGRVAIVVLGVVAGCGWVKYYFGTKRMVARALNRALFVKGSRVVKRQESTLSATIWVFTPPMRGEQDEMPRARAWCEQAALASCVTYGVEVFGVGKVECTARRPNARPGECGYPGREFERLRIQYCEVPSPQSVSAS